MVFTSTLTDNAVLAELGARLRRNRLERNLTQAQVAEEAGVSAPTIHRLEAGKSVQLTTLIRVLRFLGLLEQLEQLVPEPLPSPIDRLRHRRTERQRARPASSEEEPQHGGWRWGDENGAR